METSQQKTSPSQANANPKARRKMRNFLLQPLLQIRLGLYSISLGLVFSLVIGGILYVQLGQLIDIIIQLTDIEQEISSLFNDYIRKTQFWMLGIIFLFLVLNIVISVIYTHKLIGPTIAFRRHIRSLAEGRYEARTFLRQGDAFREVADELNNLSEVLQKQRGSKG